MRWSHRLALLGGLVAAALALRGVVGAGELPAANEASFVQMLGVWLAGLAALALAERRGADSDDLGTIRLTVTLWCNVGVVVMALLVPHPVRLLMLVAPLFGVMYGALHLSRRQVVLIAGTTWLTYLLCSVMLVTSTAADVELELIVGAAFSIMLAGALVLAWEVLALRAGFARDSQRLTEARDQLAELALRDELTGVHNRRHILDVLSRQKALADRSQQSFAILYCDLDHFKRTNDRFGHACGDDVLRRFAALAASEVRSIDFVVRFGGEEFLLVLVGADEQDAHQVASRIGARSRTLVIHPDAPDFRLTVSVGIARYEPGECVEDLIQRADRALYRAKAQGRDRVVISDAAR